MKTKPLRVALLGFGTVGGSVARILVERPELVDRIQLTHVFNRGVERKRVDWVPSSVVWTDNIDELLAAKPDAVVEVVGGVEPAGTWVRRALEQRSAVVTANKMLLAAHAPSCCTWPRREARSFGSRRLSPAGCRSSTAFAKGSQAIV